MDNVYSRLALNIIGQCEVGSVDVVVLVKNGQDRARLIDAIAYYQTPMKFEGFLRKGTKIELFGKDINIIIACKGSIQKMKFGDKRVYNLDV